MAPSFYELGDIVIDFNGTRWAIGEKKENGDIVNKRSVVTISEIKDFLEANVNKNSAKQ